MANINDLRLGKVDCNNQDLFFSKLLKGLMRKLQEDMTIRGESIDHMMIHTGDDTFWILRKHHSQIQNLTEQTNEDALYMTVPRAVVTAGAISLLPDQMTNPYARGVFQIDDEDGLRSYSAEMRRMPHTISVSVKYVVPNFRDVLELTQHMMTKLAFIRTFSFMYLGQEIPVSYKIPEQVDGEHLAELDGTTSDDKDRMITFDLEVESVMPVFNYPSITPLSSVITKPQWTVDTGTDVETRKITERSGYTGNN